MMSRLLRRLVQAAAALTLGSLALVVGYILVKGVPHLSPKLFEPEYNTQNVSMLPAIVNTLIMTAVSLAVALPLGVFAAVYLVEYARRGSRLVALIRITAETLAGIPSIIYGLFGLLFFVTAIKMGFSILAGALTLTLMILPLVLRTTEEALQAVPDLYREGAYGLGAGRLRTVFRIVLPSAAPGILAGVILAVGRIVGETAALLYTAGTVPNFPKGLLSSGRTLSVHMFALASEGLYMDQGYATAVVLLIVVFLINMMSGAIAKRIAKG